MIIKRPIGFGEVVYLAADPGLPPLNDWPDLNMMFSNLLAAAPPRPEWNSSLWDAITAQTAASTLSNFSIPPFSAVAGWLIIYIIVIGPLNFVILNRMKRRILAWWTIPALVIFFSGTAYGLRSVYLGSRPVLNRISLVQAWDGERSAEVQSLVGLYSPFRAKYTLLAQGDFFLYPYSGQSGFDASQSELESGSIVQTAGGTEMTDLPVEIGDLKIVAAQGEIPALPLTHNLVLSIQDGEPVLQGRITNAGSQILRDAILATTGGWQRLGDLAPGASRSLEIRFAPRRNGPEFYSLSADDILNLNDTDYDKLTPDELRRQDLLSSILGSHGISINRGNFGVYLLGWLDQGILPVSLQAGSFETVDTTIYIAELTPSIQYGAAPWFIPTEAMAWETSDPSYSPYDGLDQCRAGSFVLKFRPGVPIKFSSVKDLQLTVDAADTTSAEDISASLWNVKTGSWQPLTELVWGSNDIPDPTRFVGPGGAVKLRIADNNPRTCVQISPTDITLQVEP
ncbi:MAG TPA: hypothetical protein VLZ89_06925 [Anaerolineales bacterium]|nr:hypothetical protein [Anaerolineales bacterium]